MTTMIISGALLVVLWRYADPVLDTVVPFLKRVFGDFGTIWSGLVESLTYVPVMVEQLTRLLEQVIVMLEGINQIDLAGMMRYLTSMLGTMSGMLADLRGVMSAMTPMLINMGKSLSSMMNGGLGEFINSIFGDGFVENMGLIMSGMVQQLANVVQTITPLTDAMLEGVKKADMGKVADSTANMINQIPGVMNSAAGAMQAIGKGLEKIDPEQAERIIAGLGDSMEGMVNGLKGIAGLLEKLGKLLP